MTQSECVNRKLVAAQRLPKKHFCNIEPKCVDEKDAHKKSALLCGFFVPKPILNNNNQKIIDGLTKTGSVISKLCFGDAISGKIYVLQGVFVSNNCKRDSNPLEVKTHLLLLFYC